MRLGRVRLCDILPGQSLDVSGDIVRVLPTGFANRVVPGHVWLILTL